jgi:multidrug efflux pump subunit AcrA (membrane-fusion protein)
MLEEKDHKLQEAVGGEDNAEPTEPGTASEKVTGEDVNPLETSAETPEEGEKDVLDEIDESNAEDAEDADNVRRHQIPLLDYHSMSLENLVGELQRLVRNEKVQAIRKHVEGIKYEFDLKFQDFLEHKKEEFIGRGGTEADFRYNSVTKRQFNEVYSDYREKRNQYYRNLDLNLKENLANRLEIIEELKSLVNVEEDINTTYKNFKDLQERWRNAGPVPRVSYNDVWRTYHHHIEIFYDFLHLNRELRDLDFRHNLEEKLKLVERAEKLAEEPDLNKAFHELQTLHKIWKEDIGPVDQENREAIWERFSNATKAMHKRRQDFYQEQEKDYEKNLEKKHEIISKINAVASNVADNHRALQQQINEIETLREAFFKAGKVPQKVNEATWASFKDAVRSFNRNKNAFYKNLKKEQQENLESKRALLQIAISLKDSEDWETATPEMKRIQQEWKKIGHVPRKYSDKIWKDFKAACNEYFDRLHSSKNKANKEEAENLDKKNACLEKLKALQLSGKREQDIEAIKALIVEWKGLGKVPFNKKGINGKFNKLLDQLFKKLDISHQEAELLKYGNKIQQLANEENERAILKERSFIKRKITESKAEIGQLENNLQFFSDASEDSPLVQEVIQKIERHKEALAGWKAKLKKLNILQNSLIKASEEQEEGGESAEQDETEKE